MTNPVHPVKRPPWPFMSAANVRRTALVKVLSEDEPANDAGVEPPEVWPQPRSTHPAILRADEAVREIVTRPL